LKLEFTNPSVWNPGTNQKYELIFENINYNTPSDVPVAHYPGRRGVALLEHPPSNQVPAFDEELCSSSFSGELQQLFSPGCARLVSVGF
jgi:hypothetical protein